MCRTTSRIRTQLLAEAHDVPVSGHVGVAKTVDLLSRTYWWPGMHQGREAVCDQLSAVPSQQAQQPGTDWSASTPAHPCPTLGASQSWI